MTIFLVSLAYMIQRRSAETTENFQLLGSVFSEIFWQKNETTVSNVIIDLYGPRASMGDSI